MKHHIVHLLLIIMCTGSAGASRSRMLLSSEQHYRVRTVGSDYIVIDTATDTTWTLLYRRSVSWKEASASCASLVYAGFSDWTVPTKEQLASLIEPDREQPASVFPRMPSRSFWSSSPVETVDGRKVWTVDFTSGDTDPTPVEKKADIRCVRK